MSDDLTPVRPSSLGGRWLGLLCALAMVAVAAGLVVLALTSAG